MNLKNYFKLYRVEVSIIREEGNEFFPKRPDDKVGCIRKQVLCSKMVNVLFLPWGCMIQLVKHLGRFIFKYPSYRLFYASKLIILVINSEYSNL